MILFKSASILQDLSENITVCLLTGYQQALTLRRFAELTAVPYRCCTGANVENGAAAPSPQDLTSGIFTPEYSLTEI